jgi:hypothetical protein
MQAGLTGVWQKFLAAAHRLVRLKMSPLAVAAFFQKSFLWFVGLWT